MEVSGLVGNYARDNSSGFVHPVLPHTETTNIVTSADRSTSQMERTEKQMERSGSCASNATSGFIPTVKSRTATLIYTKSWTKMTHQGFNISAFHAEQRNRIAPTINKTHLLHLSLRNLIYVIQLCNLQIKRSILTTQKTLNQLNWLLLNQSVSLNPHLRRGRTVKKVTTQEKLSLSNLQNQRRNRGMASQLLLLNHKRHQVRASR